MSSKIEDLEPVTRGMCNALLADSAAAGIPLKVTYTRRTFDEQAHLWAKGRTIPGEPCHHSEGERAVGACAQHPLGATVTRAPPGSSAHNYDAGFDVAFVGVVPYPPTTDPRWALVGEMGEKLGLNWGGPRGKDDRFKFDYCHFENPNWKSLRSRT